MRALLDVNMIIALLDPDHAFHERAHAWWAANRKRGWASCPLTENGVVRIMSHPGYSRVTRFVPGDLTGRLRQFAAQSDHEFWPAGISLCDEKIFAADRIHSSGQITDLYLLALAVAQQGRLVTFDRRIPLSGVPNARASNLSLA
jgi:toxin-antitoxin system PIN domain toxin